jgi:hypothetical protein
MSVLPPGGKPVTMRSGRTGYGASAAWVSDAMLATNATA